MWDPLFNSSLPLSKAQGYRDYACQTQHCIHLQGIFTEFKNGWWINKCGIKNAFKTPEVENWVDVVGAVRRTGKGRIKKKKNDFNIWKLRDCALNVTRVPEKGTPLEKRMHDRFIFLILKLYSTVFTNKLN